MAAAALFIGALSVLTAVVLVGTGSEVQAASSERAYTDPALGITFTLPRGTYYHPARLTNVPFRGAVVHGWLSTYPEQHPPTDRNFLVVEFHIETLRPGMDILERTRRAGLEGAFVPQPMAVAGHLAGRADHLGINGPRTDIFVVISPDRVLRVAAYPLQSRHIGLLERVLTSLTVGARP